MMKKIIPKLFLRYINSDRVRHCIKIRLGSRSGKGVHSDCDRDLDCAVDRD